MYYKLTQKSLSPNRARPGSFLRNLTVAFVIVQAGASMGLAQQIDPKQDVLKIPVEEVRVPVFASDEHGRFDMQLSVDDLLIREAAEAARAIDSQYVVTYKPQRPLAEAKPGEYRKLDVISRRVGLRVRSRRGYVVAGNPKMRVWRLEHFAA